MWNEFFVAIAGAAAALAGLIFVGVSINLTRIISIDRLPDRALQAIILMLTVLVVSVLCLVPAQSDMLIGLELLAVGVIAWVVTFRLDLRILSKTSEEYKNAFMQSMMLSEAAVLPYVVAGAVVLAYGSGVGLYWVVPAVIASFIKAVFDAWVLLVEINR